MPYWKDARTDDHASKSINDFVENYHSSQPNLRDGSLAGPKCAYSQLITVEQFSRNGSSLHPFFCVLLSFFSSDVLREDLLITIR